MMKEAKREDEEKIAMKVKIATEEKITVQEKGTEELIAETNGHTNGVSETEE